MGRRSLPRVDKNIDLSEFLFSLPEAPASWEPRQLFDRQFDLEIEVGSGKGLFLTNAGKQFPERNFLGIEIARKYARFAAARLARHGLTNAKLIHGDAMRLFVDYVPSDQIAAVHVYFPDPWWKKRHRRRRVLNAALVRNVQRVLVPHGQFHFWTDVREYFESSLQLIAESTSLAGPFEVAEQQPQHDLDYRTHFERRMRLHQEAVYRARFEQSESAGPDAPT